MGNFIAITNQTGSAVVPADMNGQITDIYIAAGAATKVAAAGKMGAGLGRGTALDLDAPRAFADRRPHGDGSFARGA